MKYNNKKTVLNGIVFDSRKEAMRYVELKVMEHGGLISDLQLQVPFCLQEKVKVGGKTLRPITYIADFVYYENGERIVEDVKGMKTEVYKLKRKLLAAKYGILTREV